MLVPVSSRLIVHESRSRSDPLLVPVGTCVRGRTAARATQPAPRRFVDHLGRRGDNQALGRNQSSYLSLDPAVDRRLNRLDGPCGCATKFFREGPPGGFEESASPTQSAGRRSRHMMRPPSAGSWSCESLRDSLVCASLRSFCQPRSLRSGVGAARLDSAPRCAKRRVRPRTGVRCHFGRNRFFLWSGAGD